MELGDQIKVYLDDLKQKAGKSSFIQHRLSLDRLNFFLNGVDIEKIDISDLRIDFVNYLREVHSLKNVSIVYTLQCVRNFFKFLRKNGVETIDPQKIIPLALWRAYTEDRKKDLSKSLKQEEILSLKRYWERKGDDITKLRNRIIVSLLTDFGLKTSEISKLGIDDVDFEFGKIVIRSPRKHRNRTLKLSLELQDLIQQYLSLRKDGSNKLFVSLRRVGEQGLTNRSIQRIVRDTAADLNLVATPRSLRHTLVGKKLVENGTRKTTRLLGYKSSWYTRTHPENSKISESEYLEEFVLAQEAAKKLGYTTSGLLQLCKRRGFGKDDLITVKQHRYIKKDLVEKIAQKPISRVPTYRPEGYISLGEAAGKIGYTSSGLLFFLRRKYSEPTDFMKAENRWFVLEKLVIKIMEE